MRSCVNEARKWRGNCPLCRPGLSTKIVTLLVPLSLSFALIHFSPKEPSKGKPRLEVNYSQVCMHSRISVGGRGSCTGTFCSNIRLSRGPLAGWAGLEGRRRGLESRPLYHGQQNSIIKQRGVPNPWGGMPKSMGHP